MRTTRLQSFQTPQPVTYAVGPVTAIQDADAPIATVPGMVTRLFNCYLRETDDAPVVVGRTGFTAMGAGYLLTSTGDILTTSSGDRIVVGQIGSTGARTVQWIGELVKQSGTRTTVAVAGGSVWTYSWAADAWAEVVSAANLTTASITLSTTSRCFAVVFADGLVVTDGTNKPFHWDGTTGAGGLTSLTNAPVAFGPPWVYYGKLFFLKATERTAIVWSEEGQPNTGYEAGGFNNAWAVIQTGSQPFHAAVATNTAIYLFRQSGVTWIQGAVTDQFQSTGTRDAISENIGCISPAAVMVWDQMVYFLGSDRRLYRILGVGLEEVGKGFRATLGRLQTSKLPLAEFAQWDGSPSQRHIVLGVASTGSATMDTVLAIDAATGHAAGLWGGWTSERMGTVTNADGTEVLCHAGGAGALTTAEGFIYRHGNAGESLFSDEFGGGTVAIDHAVVTGYLGFDTLIDKLFDRMDCSFLIPTNLTDVTIAVLTSRGTHAAQTLPTVTGAGSVSLWDAMTWDTDSWSGDSVEAKSVVGLEAQGRWAQVTITHSTLGEQFQLESLLVRGFALDDGTEVP